MKKILLTFTLLLCFMKLTAEAPKYGYLMTCSKKGRITVHKPSGEIIWEHPAKKIYTANLLANGNILYVEDRVGCFEVTPKKKIVMEFKEKGEIYTVRRLKNGDTLLGNCSKNQAILIAPDGQEKKRLQLKGKKGHMAHRHFTITPDENSFLVGHIGSKVLIEYDFDGNIIKEFPAKGMVYTGLRSRNGDTYISWQYGIDKVTKDGDSKTLITLNEKSKPFVHFFTDISFYSKQRLYVSSWLGHRKEGKGPNVMLIDQEGKIEWQLNNHDQIANNTSFTPLTKSKIDAFKKALK